MEVKGNRKISAVQIKTLAASKAAPVNSDTDAPVRVPHKKKESTGVLPARKNQVKNTSKHHGAQCY